MAYKFQKGPFDSNGTITGSTTITAQGGFLGNGAALQGITGSEGTVAHGVATGSVRVARLEIDSTADYMDIVSSDLTLVAAADILLNPGGGEAIIDGNLVSQADSTDALGASGLAWSKLWVDAIDLNGQGDISIGGTGRIDLDADDDTSIRASADDVITFELAGADKIDITATAIHPESDALMDLGTTTLGFNDLHLGEDGVINFDNGDVTLTHATNALTMAGGSLTVNGSVTIGASDGSSDILSRGLHFLSNGIAMASLTTGSTTDNNVASVPNGAHVVLCSGSGGNLTLRLPAIASISDADNAKGYPLWIKRAYGQGRAGTQASRPAMPHNIVISCSAADTIDGTTSITLNTAGASVLLLGTGSFDDQGSQGTGIWHVF